MMWTKIRNILLQEMHCAYLVIPAAFSKGSSFESISLLVVCCREHAPNQLFGVICG